MNQHKFKCTRCQELESDAGIIRQRQPHPVCHLTMEAPWPLEQPVKCPWLSVIPDWQPIKDLKQTLKFVTNQHATFLIMEES